MKINKGLVLGGLLLAIAAFAGIFVIGNQVNKNPVYVLAANVDINQGTDIKSIGQESLVEVPMTGSTELLNTFVSRADYIAMQQAGGQFINFISRYEPIKYSDIMSSANPLSSRVISLGQDDPNLVVMTINVTGFAPIGIREGDYVDIIATVSNYGTDAAYENSLANLMLEARSKALSAIELPTASVVTEEETQEDYAASDFDFGSFGTETDAAAGTATDAAGAATDEGFTVEAPSITDEIMERTQELEDKASELQQSMASLQEFLDVYGSIDPVTLSEKLKEGFYLAPLSKVLVQGAKVVSVNREEVTNYDGSASNALGEVQTLDVLVPRDSIEWVAMANEAGSLRIAVLSTNATPSGSGPTLGAALQDFVEAFVEDRGDEGKGSTIPSSR